MSAVSRPPMIWIGGAPGSGKSTLGRAIAHAVDLPLHPIDRWTYVHAARQPGPPLDQVLARGASAAADAFVESARDRIDLVLDDVRGRDLGPVPALLEGPQLLPDLAADLPSGHAVWLLPDTEQTRRARERRLEGLSDPAARERLVALVQRDAVIADRLRVAASAAGRTVIELGPEPDWPAVRSAVEHALAPALDHAARLAPGPQLAAQRRFENDAAAHQIDLWTAAEQITPAPVFAYACECGRSGCARTWSGTTTRYRSEAGRGSIIAEIGTAE